MEIAAEIVLFRLLVLYVIVHIIALIKDIYEYKTSIWNIKYFLESESIIMGFLKIDIVVMGIIMSVSFLLFGDFFYLFSLIINQL